MQNIVRLNITNGTTKDVLQSFIDAAGDNAQIKVETQIVRADRVAVALHAEWD